MKLISNWLEQPISFYSDICLINSVNNITRFLFIYITFSYSPLLKSLLKKILQTLVHLRYLVIMRTPILIILIMLNMILVRKRKGH